MTRGLKALIPIVFLSAVAVAHAQGPDRRVAVFVTAATTASQEMAGSVEDVKRAVEGAGIRGRRKHLTLVDSATDAHLIVELRARRSAFGMPVLFGRNYTVIYAVKPGSKITAAQFARMPRGDGSADRTGAAAQDPPELLLEASVKGSWKLAGAIVATRVDTLAERHADLLLKSAAEAP
jgi:hypothetical protein